MTGFDVFVLMLIAIALVTGSLSVGYWLGSMNR